jgi:hypothetical protein
MERLQRLERARLVYIRRDPEENGGARGIASFLESRFQLEKAAPKS